MPTDPYIRARRGTLLILGLNAGLCVSKAIVGWLGGSFALMADAANNLTDAGLSLGLYLGMRLASRPPDHEHAYGHGKVEPEVARIVGIVILIVAGSVIFGATHRLGEVHGPPHLLVLGVALVSILIKEGMFRYQRRLARELSSGALAADALNHRSDAAATSTVLLGSLVIWVAGPQFSATDDVAAILVGVIMALAAARVIMRASSELLDEMPPANLVTEVRRIANSVPGVLGVEKLIGRKMGLTYMLDLHLEVSGSMRVADAHDLGHVVRQQILDRAPAVSDVLVHIEPSRGERKEGVDLARQVPTDRVDS